MMKKLIIILLFIPAISFAQDSKTLIVHGDTLWFKNITQNDSLQLTKTGGSTQTWTNKTMSTGSVWNGTAIGDSYISSAATWNAKVNISDTAAALSPYLRINVAAATYQPIGTYATGSGTANGTNTGDQTISDATISTTDITTNDVSTSKHGFAPKLSNNATQYLNGTGGYSTPTNVNSTITWLSGDVTNNNASANTIADVTGLSFAVTSGVTYRFKFFIVYTSAATTTGSRWSINGPATTFINYNSNYTLTATSQTLNSGVSAYNTPAAASASSLASGNIAIIEGIIKPSANGTVIARFASEISASAIVAKAAQSYVEFQAVN